MKKALALFLTLIIVFGCFTVCLPTSVVAAEETDVDRNLLAGITIDDWVGGSDTRLLSNAKETTVSRYGGYSFISTSAYYLGIRLPFSVESGKTYELTFSAKAAATWEGASVLEVGSLSFGTDGKNSTAAAATDATLKSALNENVYKEATVSGKNLADIDEAEWTDAEIVFTPTADSSTYALYLAWGTNNSSYGDVIISDLCLKEYSTVPTYYEGNGAVKAEPSIACDGDQVTYTANPYGDDVFLGWYNGRTLISEETSIVCTSFEDVPTAKFSGVNLLADVTYADWFTSSDAMTVEDGTLYSRYGGKNSIKIKSSWRGTYLTLAVEAGKTYKLSFNYYLPTHSNGTEKIAFKLGTNVTYSSNGEQSNGSWLKTDDITSPLDTWTLWEYEFTATAESYDLTIGSGWNAGIILSDFSLATPGGIPVYLEGNGAVSVNPELGYYGEDVTYTATANYGEEFLGWYIGDECVSTETSYDGKISIDVPTAKFTKINLLGDKTFVDWIGGSDNRALNNASSTTLSHKGGYAFRSSSAHYMGIRLPFSVEANISYTLTFSVKSNIIWETASVLDVASLTFNSEGKNTTACGATDATVKTKLVTAQGDGSLSLLDEASTVEWVEVEYVIFPSADSTYALCLAWGANSGSYCDVVISDVFLKENISGSVKNQDVKVLLEQSDGTATEDIENYNIETFLTDNSDGTSTAKLVFDDLDKMLYFKGWYNGESLLSHDATYTFNTSDICADDIYAKFLNRNVLNGAASFEGYNNGESLRVSPIEQGTLPYDDKWGMWSEFSTPNYEGADVDFSLYSVMGEQTVSTIDYLSLDEEGNQVKNFGEYTVTPHSGELMIKSDVIYRAMVRKIENLKANTAYTVSFYVNNPDRYNFLSEAIVGDTYDIPNGKIVSTSDYTIYGAFKETRKSAEIGDTPMLADDSMVKNWKKVTFNFVTGDDNYAYLQFAFIKKTGCGSVFIDDLTIFETVHTNNGNAIRATDSALRYKFAIPNDVINGFADATTEKIGVLVLADEKLNGEELVIGESYTENNYTPIEAEVTEANYQYVDGDTTNTYFVVSLYNIGRKDGAMDYNAYGDTISVRPYITFNSEDGSSFTIYGDTVSASIFDVMKTIKYQATSDEDIAIVDDMLKNEALYEIFMDLQTKEGWYIDKSHASDYDYSMAVVGDIQITTEYYHEKLHYMYDWIVNNKDNANIQYAFTLGDITNNNTENEWVTAEEQLKRVSANDIDHAIIRGNHDWSYDSYITYDEYGNGFISYDGTMKSYYKLTEIGGVKYMMLTLELFAQDDVLEWAKGVVDEHNDYNVILSTHAYLSYDNGTFGFGQEDTLQWGYENDETRNCGQDIYDKLVSQCSNIVLVLCGHDCMSDNSIGRLDSVREDGSKVTQLMINHQNMESNGGQSYNMLAMLYFSNGGKNVQVEYFSTINGMFYMENNQFEFELDLID